MCPIFVSLLYIFFPFKVSSYLIIVNFTNYLPRPHPMCHAKRRDIIEKSGKRDFESLEKNRIKGEN